MTLAESGVWSISASVRVAETTTVSPIRRGASAVDSPPVFAPLAARAADEVMLALGHESVQAVSQSAGQGANRPLPTARDLGFTPVLPLLVTGANIQPEDTVKGAFAYEWDAKKGIFRTPNGDVAAEHISAYTVNDVVGKFILLDFLKAVGNTGEVRLEFKDAQSAGQMRPEDANEDVKYRYILMPMRI